MSLYVSIISVIAGLALVIYFSEQLVKGVVGTSLHFNISAFIISVIFVGFDPENLGVGAVASYESVSGIAAGSIIGAAMVAIALALGITALLAPLQFQNIPKRILLIPLFSVLLFASLVIDQTLGRLDGLILLLGYVLAVIYLIKLNRSGIKLEAGGEVAETLERDELPGKWSSAGLMIVSIVIIIGGSELLVNGSKKLLAAWNISDTVYGMTVLALLVSIEEIARELPAALKGKPDISIGNVFGSVMAFFLFNAGFIGIVKPVKLNAQVIEFYLPISVATIGFILVLLAVSHQIPRWAGIILIMIYIGFILGGYWL